MSVPGKVLARILLEHMKPAIQGSRRREQSGFTPVRSTVDGVLALNIPAQKRRKFRQPLYVAYIDLKAAFDSIDRNVLFNLLKISGVPEKLVSLFRALRTGAISCVRCDGMLSDWFTIDSGVMG